MTPRRLDADYDTITAYVDAAAPGIGPADFVIVFGTRFTEPAQIAARI